MTYRRTERIPFDFTKDSPDPPPKAFGRFVPFTYYAQPNDPLLPLGVPVLEPWILSISCKVAYYNAGGANLGVTDYPGLRLQATLVDYDLFDEQGRPPIAPATYTAFADNENTFDVAAIDDGSTIKRRLYGSNATSDGYPVPRAVVPDSRCQYPRTYYFTLLLYAGFDPSDTGGTVPPPGGLPDGYSFRGVWFVDHEWRERMT
jgi:hypothetical protein